MGTTKRRRLIGLLVAVGVVLLGAVPAQAQAPTTAPAKPSADAKPLDSVTKLTVALLPNVNAAALYLAQAKGYFKAEKLDVNIINGGSLVDSLPLLSTGRVDATYAGASAGFFNQVANGVEVQYVSGAGQSRKGGAASAFIVKTGGPIKTLSDLRGKKVTAPGLTGGISAYYLSELLKQANMTVEDVQLVNTDVPGGLAALKNGAVSAALSSGPVMTEALSSGAFQIIGDMDKVLSIGNGGGYILGPSLLKKNRRAGVAFVRALLKTTRKELQGEFLKNKENVQYISKATGSPTWVIKQTAPPIFDPNMTITFDPFDRMQKFWRAHQATNYAPNLKPARLIDEQILKDATLSYK